MFFTTILFLVVILSACKMTATFKDSSVLPNATGSANATVNKKNNYTLVVNVEHLIDVAKLNPDAKVYVVWAETKRAGVIKVGSLNIDGNMVGALTSNLKYRPRRVFITAEKSSQVFLPEGQIVLRSKFL